MPSNSASSPSPSPALTCEIVDVTPELAQHLRATCAFERQRAINPRNVERLSGEMRRGTFIPGTPISLAVLPNKSMLLLNGNHTLEAIQASGLTQPLTLIYMPVATHEHAGHLYACMDLQKVRSWQDAYKGVGLGTELNTSWMASFGASVRTISASFNENPKERVFTQSRELILSIMEEYMPIAEAYRHSLGELHVSQEKLLRRSAVMSIALELFKFQPVKGRAFFSAIAEDSGLERGDARKTLLNWLRNNNTSSTTERTAARNALMLSWNAHFKGEPLAMLKPNSVVEFRLLGTPWGPGYSPFQEKIEGKGTSRAAKTSPRVSKNILTGKKLVGKGDTQLVSEFQQVRAP